MAPRWFVKLSLLINDVSYVHFMSAATGYSVLLFAQGYSYSALVFLGTMLFTLSVVGALKLITAVERPVECLVPLCNTRRAFPSGHTAAAAFVGTMVPYTLPISAALSGSLVLHVSLFALVAVVALSRLTLRAHTLFQVIAGFVVGVAVPILTIILVDPPLVEWLLSI